MKKKDVVVEAKEQPEPDAPLTLLPDGTLVGGPKGLNMDELVAFVRVYRGQKYLNELIGPDVVKRWGLEKLDARNKAAIATYCDQRLRGCSNRDELLVGIRCEVREHAGGKIELRAYLPGWTFEDDQTESGSGK